MKPLNRFIKGTLISLILVMVFNVGIPLLLPSSSPFAAKNVFAEIEGAGGICDPDFENKNYDEEACDAKIAEDKANADAEGDGGPKDVGEMLRNIEKDDEAPTDAKNSEDLVRQVASLANKTHRIFSPLINFFAFKIGNFLGTDYIYNGAMGEMLHSIWVISRNLVNISFVFLLLLLALKTIFQPGFALPDLAKRLGIFVLLLIAVNFSWLGTKVVLDAANVATHVVFAIPSGISDPPTANQCKVNDPDDPIEGACYPTAIIAPADSGTTNPYYWEDTEGEGGGESNCENIKKRYGGVDDAADDAAYKADGTKNVTKRDASDNRISGASDENEKLQGRTSICMENLNLVKYDQNTAVIYLTYGMARIQNLVATVGTPKVDDLAVSVLLSLVIQLAYTISLLALFIALIIRMAVLWMFVAFSPFLVLVIWFSEGAYTDKDFGEFKFGIPEFINWAFVPAKVGAVFAVSFIMISAGQSLDKLNLKAFDNLSSKSGFVAEMPDVQTLFGGIGSLQNFIWLLMTLGVLWMGTFAILSKMSIVKNITDRIKDFGQTTATKIATLPYKAPILPLGKGGKKMSVRDMVGTMDVRPIIDKYTGEEDKAENVLKLEAKAGKDRAIKAVNQAKANNFTFKPNEARKFADAFGLEFKQIANMDREVLKNAFIKSGADSDQAGKIIDGLQKAEKMDRRGLGAAGGKAQALPPVSEAEKARRDKATGQHQAEGALKVNKQTPPAAAAAAPPPPADE